MALSRSQKARLQQEMAILDRYFPGFALYASRGELFAEGPVRTNSGTVYAARVVLPDDYPNSIPMLLVTHPRPLLDWHGRDLGTYGLNHLMHLLCPAEGCPAICHCRPDLWGPTRSLYLVVMKARIWLAAYEMHLRTGKTIDHFLIEQGANQ